MQVHGLRLFQILTVKARVHNSFKDLAWNLNLSSSSKCHQTYMWANYWPVWRHTCLAVAMVHYAHNDMMCYETSFGMLCYLTIAKSKENRDVVEKTRDNLVTFCIWLSRWQTRLLQCKRSEIHYSQCCSSSKESWCCSRGRRMWERWTTWWRGDNCGRVFLSSGLMVPRPWGLLYQKQQLVAWHHLLKHCRT